MTEVIASPAIFYVFAGIAVVGALSVILQKNPVTAALNLVLVFFCFAALYAMMEAHLMAALQVLVYAGAVMVLFVFVIMLLGADTPSLDLDRAPGLYKFFAPLIFVATLVAFYGVFARYEAPSNLGAFDPAAVEKAGGNTRVISELLFSDYVLPFELTAILLLGVMVGVVAIAMRKKPHRKVQS